MSSLKQIFRPLFLLAFLALLSGCGFQPLYGKRAENPLPQLASIKIHPIADRTGQILRNYLLNELTPRGQPRNPKYTLSVEVTESLGSYGIQKDDTATRAILKLSARFTLTRVSDDASIVAGSAHSSSGYDILLSSFATLSAERDARKHALKLISEDIKLRLSFFLSRYPYGPAPERREN